LEKDWAFLEVRIAGIQRAIFLAEPRAGCCLFFNATDDGDAARGQTETYPLPELAKLFKTAEVAYLRSHLRVLVRDNGRGIDERIVRSGRAFNWAC